MKPICVPCQRFYRPKKNGVSFIEGMPTDNAAPGTAEPEKWKPYKLWVGDLWECQGCGHQLIVGAPSLPYREHYQPDFDYHVEQRKPIMQVNDC
jgi:hypothetical protein